MVEQILQLIPYFPIIIFIAAILDIFFVTGLFLYGAAMIGSIFMMYSKGMVSLEEIIIASYAGTVLGNTLNYFSGRLFDKAPIVDKKLQHPKIQKAKTYLQTNGLFFYILVFRFIAVSRPLYALVLGSLRIKYYRFILFEAIVAFLWVIFWLFIIVQGKEILTKMF